MHEPYAEDRKFSYIYDDGEWRASGIRCTEPGCDWSVEERSEQPLINQWTAHALADMIDWFSGPVSVEHVAQRHAIDDAAPAEYRLAPRTHADRAWLLARLAEVETENVRLREST